MEDGGGTMEIIINADDLGLTEAANEGIRQAFQRGFCSQTTIVVNSEHSEEGAEIAYKEGFSSKVGLHLNLCEGPPLTNEIQQFDQFVKKGGFNYTPEFLEKESYSKSPIYTYFEKTSSENFAKLVLALRKEIEAQIKKYLTMGFTMMHIDSHRNTLIDLPVWLAAKPLLKKYKFTSIRTLFASYHSKEIMNQIYAGFIHEEFSKLPIKRTDYSSSIPRYLKNREIPLGSKEIYVHPILLNGKLIDNFTGGKTVAENYLDLTDQVNAQLITFLDI